MGMYGDLLRSSFPSEPGLLSAVFKHIDLSKNQHIPVKSPVSINPLGAAGSKDSCYKQLVMTFTIVIQVVMHMTGLLFTIKQAYSKKRCTPV